MRWGLNVLPGYRLGGGGRQLRPKFPADGTFRTPEEVRGLNPARARSHANTHAHLAAGVAEARLGGATRGGDGGGARAHGAHAGTRGGRARTGESTHACNPLHTCDSHTFAL